MGVWEFTQIKIIGYHDGTCLVEVLRVRSLCATGWSLVQWVDPNITRMYYGMSYRSSLEYSKQGHYVW